MARVERFEDLIAGQKARELTREIYRATAVAPFAGDFALRDQIRRASVSILADIAEGFERGRRTEFHQFLSTATSSWEVGRILGGLRASVDPRLMKRGRPGETQT